MKLDRLVNLFSPSGYNYIDYKCQTMKAGFDIRDLRSIRPADTLRLCVQTANGDPGAANVNRKAPCSGTTHSLVTFLLA